MRKLNYVAALCSVFVSCTSLSFAGAYAGAIIPAETWYPERYSYKDGLRSGTYSLAGGFVINSVREFLFNW